MLKELTYWAFLNRRFTGRLSGNEHWILGFGPIWTTLLPMFSVGEYLLVRTIGRTFDLPWHIILSGITAIVVAIGADYIGERKNWNAKFAQVHGGKTEAHMRISAVVAIAGFLLYIATVFLLWEDLRRF